MNTKNIDHKRLETALTSKRWEWCYYEGDTCPPTVLEALCRQLTHIDAASWPERESHGGIYLNGRAAQLSAQLSAPCRLEYFEPGYKIGDAADYFPAFDRDWIVHQDADLLIVHKPQGLPCLPNREQSRYNLKTYLQTAFDKRIHLPSRLDTSTGGLVIISASERMNAPLQQSFERRTIEKYYVMEASSALPEVALTLHCQIGRHPEHAVLRQVVSEGGREAQTHFTSLTDSAAGETARLLARPVTGRTHQLRVQTQHLGCPIVGDNFYGGLPADRLHLFCYRLRFANPFSGELVDVILPERYSPNWLESAARQRAIELSE